MQDNINQEELSIRMLALELEEQEKQIHDLEYQIRKLNEKNKILSRKRTDLLKNKVDLKNKLSYTEKSDRSELFVSLDYLCSISFFNHPINKYRAYKEMINHFHKAKWLINTI